MAYTLRIHCLQATGKVRVNKRMPFTKIMEAIGNRFNISTDSFEVQVYDPISQKYIDFDEEYNEELRHQTNTGKNKMIDGRVLLQDAESIASIVGMLYTHALLFPRDIFLSLKRIHHQHYL